MGGLEYQIFDDDNNNHGHNKDAMEYIDPDSSLNTLLNCNSLLNDSLLHHAQPINYNTDIPALDSLFSELNSDLNFDQQGGMVAVGKSEPVNLDDIERILLPQSTRRSSKIKMTAFELFSFFHHLVFSSPTTF